MVTVTRCVNFHSIQVGLIKTQDDKVNKIQDAKVPLTKKQVRSFLGLTGYYHKFIANYSELAAPLTDLTKKGMPETVKWSPEPNNAFEMLKTLLCKEPVLHLPNLDLPFVLRTDASEIGMGAVLLQYIEQMYHPIAYASKKLNQAQRAYAMLERECLAIVWAVDKFKAYLYGRAFTLQTDHQSLKFMASSRFENNRVMRWALKLQSYRYTVEDIPGRDNVGADLLSRV